MLAYCCHHIPKIRRKLPIQALNRKSSMTTQQVNVVSAAAAAADEKPWHAAYPAPRSEVQWITRQEVLQLLKSEAQSSRKSFVLVDLRRTDFEGGTVLGAINLPAQSLWPSIPSLYGLFKAAGVKQVIWYCGE